MTLLLILNPVELTLTQKAFFHLIWFLIIEGFLTYNLFSNLGIEITFLDKAKIALITVVFQLILLNTYVIIGGQ